MLGTYSTGSKVTVFVKNASRTGEPVKLLMSVLCRLRSSPPNANGLALEDRQRLNCHTVYTGPSNLHTDRRTPTELDDFKHVKKNVLTKLYNTTDNKHAELFFFTFYFL